MILELVLIILRQVFVHIPLIIGAYVSISLLRIPDLSIESAYVCGALCGARMVVMLQGTPLQSLMLPIAILVSLCAGLLVGAVSSMLTQKAGFPHLLSSITTTGIFHGVNQLLASGYISLSSYDNPLALIGNMPYQSEMIILTCLGIVLLVLFYILLNTQLGYAYAIYGNNPAFFSCYGISKGYVFMSGIMLSNACAGLSGYLFAQVSGFAEINMGMSKVLLCITTLIIGKVLCMSNKPINFMMIPIGTLGYFSVQQLLLKIGFNLKLFTMVQALIVLALLLVFFKQQRTPIRDPLGV